MLVVVAINLLIFLFQFIGEDDSVNNFEQGIGKIKNLALLSPEQRLRENTITVALPPLAPFDLDDASSYQIAPKIADSDIPAIHRPQSIEKIKEPIVTPERVMPTKTISLCYEVGPFDKEQDVLALQDKLFEHHLTSTVIDRKLSEFAGYWVFLPTYSSTARARLVVEELKAKGVKDIVRIPYGEEKNTVSLGVYNNKSSADGVQKKIIQLGYEAQLKERQRLVDTTWVEVTTTQKNNLDELAWLALLSDDKTAKSQAIPCN